MTLDKSVLSELLGAFRTGEGLDLIKEAAALVCQELIEVELAATLFRRFGVGPVRQAISPRWSARDVATEAL